MGTSLKYFNGNVTYSISSLCVCDLITSNKNKKSPYRQNVWVNLLQLKKKKRLKVSDLTEPKELNSEETVNH